MLCPKIFSSMSKHHWCNWSSIFWYHWCYAQRSSRQVSKISDSTLKDLLLTFLTLCYSDLLFTFQTSSMRRSKIFSGLFSHSTRIDVMLVTSFLSTCTIIDAMLEDLLFNSQACLMLLSTIFSSLVRHTWMYVPQDLFFKFQTSVMVRAKIFSSISSIIEATLQDLLFHFLTSSRLRSKIFFSSVQHHRPSARRFSCQFSTVTSWCYILGSSLQHFWRHVPRSALVFSNMPRPKI